MRFRLLFFIILVSTVGITQAQTDSPLLYGNSRSLPFRLLKPIESSPGKKPLVIFLHGISERGKDNVKSTKFISPLFLDSINRLSYPTYLLIPQCPPGKFWTTNSVTINLSILIDSLSNAENIDKKRIYITGLSMGGFGTWNMITKYPAKFAAAIPICGGGDAKKAYLLKDIPIWAFHGEADTIVSVNQSRKMIAAIKGAGGSPRYTEYKNVGHNSWSVAYREPELLEWLFSKKKN